MLLRGSFWHGLVNTLRQLGALPAFHYLLYDPHKLAGVASGGGAGGTFQVSAGVLVQQFHQTSGIGGVQQLPEGVPVVQQPGGFGVFHQIIQVGLWFSHGVYPPSHSIYNGVHFIICTCAGKVIVMKLLVFSDSHGAVDGMARAVDLECPDQILHLGDLVRDAERLADWYPELPLTNVCGNCDGWCNTPDERLIAVGGRRLMLTHGHGYRVKAGPELAVEAARARGADVLLFGHTHQPLCECRGGLWVMNPGAVGAPIRRTYGVIVVENGVLDCRISQL